MLLLMFSRMLITPTASLLQLSCAADTMPYAAQRSTTQPQLCACGSNIRRHLHSAKTHRNGHTALYNLRWYLPAPARRPRHGRTF
jgi:hypothetical protein